MGTESTSVMAKVQVWKEGAESRDHSTSGLTVGDYVTTDLSKPGTHGALVWEGWSGTGVEKVVTDVSQNRPVSFDLRDNFMLFSQTSIIGFTQACYLGITWLIVLIIKQVDFKHHEIPITMPLLIAC